MLHEQAAGECYSLLTCCVACMMRMLLQPRGRVGEWGREGSCRACDRRGMAEVSFSLYMPIGLHLQACDA